MQTTPIEQVLIICTAVITVGGAVTVILKWFSPLIKLSSRVAEIERRQKLDCASLNDLKDMNAILCRGMLSLIEHQVSGDSINELKKSKDELRVYLTSR